MAESPAASLVLEPDEPKDRPPSTPPTTLELPLRGIGGTTQEPQNEQKDEEGQKATHAG